MYREAFLQKSIRTTLYRGRHRHVTSTVLEQEANDVNRGTLCTATKQFLSVLPRVKPYFPKLKRRRLISGRKAREHGARRSVLQRSAGV